MKRLRNNRRGFTLAEVLIVVGIIIALAGVSVVGVVRYQRSLKQLELDDIAKEIFVAAQNHLTMAESQDYLGKKKFGKEEMAENDEGKTVGTGIFYFIVGGVNNAENGSYSNPDAASDAVLSLMLPFASVDETVRLGGSYVVRYQKNPGLVLDVFYAEKDGKRFGHTYDSVEYGDLMSTYRGPGNKGKRQNVAAWNNAVLGWYGGEGAKALIPELKEPLKQPKVVLHNEETLWAEITDPNVTDPAEGTLTRKLVIEGLTSGNKRVIAFDSTAIDGNPWVKDSEASISNEKNVYRVILDDVTQSADKHFFSICCSSSDDTIKNLIPGENIRAYVVISSPDSLVTDTKIDYSNDENSLFDTGTTTTQALIGNFRHLENLGKAISNLEANDTNDKLKISSAKQTADISWPDFTSVFSSDIKSVSINAVTTNEQSEGGCILPIYREEALVYDGDGKKISKVTSENTGRSGLFGDLISESKVYDLTLLDFNVNSTGSATRAASVSYAGALAGSATGTTVYNVLAYNSSDAKEIGIRSVGSSGGLIGSMSGGGVYFSAAALYVESSGSGSASGGLIGTVNGTVTVTGSYSGGHTEDMVYDEKSWNVKANSGTAGGLIGDASGVTQLTVDHSYTTCSASGSIAGGFIGSSNNTTVSDSYATGLVSGTTASDPFIAVPNRTPTITDCKYVSLKKNTEEEYVESSLTTGLTGVRADDWAGSEDHSFILLPDQRKDATCYDEKLSAKYQSRYYFPTIQQLFAADGVANSMDEALNRVALLLEVTISGSPALATHHYGDWQVPIPYPLEYGWKNGDTLALVIDYSDYAKVNSAMNEGKPGTILAAVTGETSKNTRVFRLELKKDSNDKYYYSIVKEGTVAHDSNGKMDRSASIDWKDSVSTNVSTNLSIEIDVTAKTVTLTFDDITQAGGKFAELCGTGDCALIPGENVTARVNTLQSWSELLGDYDMLLTSEKENKTDNSLFAQGSTDSNAQIAKIRHLQNLDPVISNVSDTVKTAEIDADQVDDDDADKKLTWDDGVYSSIYQNNSGGHVSHSFFGIYNPNLTSFDGNGKTIFNLAVTNTTGITANGSGNAGLFRLINNDLTVKNLRLSGGTFAASSGDAGGLAGKVDATDKTVSFTNVLVEGKTVSVTVSGSNAGGLVGSMTGGSVTKSAAAVTVSGSGSAGGLIGSASGATVTASYSGGQTDKGEYYTHKADGTRNTAIYNVTGGTAGGLIGSASGTNISYSYSTCSASGATAGGLVGSISGGSVENTYATGLISGTTAGAFAGSVTGEPVTLSGVNQYYDIINNEVTTSGNQMNPVGSDSDVTLAKLDADVDSFDDFVQVKAAGAAPAAAKPYDDYLKGIFKRGEGDSVVYVYDLKTVTKLGAEVSATDGIPDFVATHYGDWPSPEVWVINTSTGGSGGSTDPSIPDGGVHPVNGFFLVTLKDDQGNEYDLSKDEYRNRFILRTSDPDIVEWDPEVRALYFTDANASEENTTLEFYDGQGHIAQILPIEVRGTSNDGLVDHSVKRTGSSYTISYTNKSDHAMRDVSITLKTEGEIEAVSGNFTNLASAVDSENHTVTLVYAGTGNVGILPGGPYEVGLWITGTGNIVDID